MSYPSLSDAKKAIAAFPIKTKNMELRSLKRKTNKKAVWAIETDKGKFIMKRVPLDKDRILFMVHAIDFLRSNGVNTPQVIRTRNGEVFTNIAGENYVVFEAVYGRTPDYAKSKDLKKIMEGLALFHKGSTGFESPLGYYPSFLLNERKKNYLERYTRLAELKKEKMNSATLNEFDQLFLNHVDSFLKQGESSLTQFNNKPYDEWADSVHTTINLCHQDYAEKNLVITDKSDLYVFDMDSLTVDLPIRDIRKILNKVMKKEADWNLDVMIKMLKDYQRVNPLTKEQYEILGAEIMFPHLFYDQATTYYYNRQNDWTEQKHIAKLNHMILTETSKEKTLRKFFQRIGEVVK